MAKFIEIFDLDAQDYTYVNEDYITWVSENGKQATICTSIKDEDDCEYTSFRVPVTDSLKRWLDDRSYCLAD